MYLIPLVRTERAIAACILNPNHPIFSIALSETASVILPLLNPKILQKYIGILYSFIYAPSYISEFIKYYEKKELKYYQAEISLLLLFIVTGLIKLSPTFIY